MSYSIQPAYTLKSRRNAILRYMLLPEIMPRIRNALYAIRRIFFVFPQILLFADLIPANHPCVNPGTAQRYKTIDSFLVAWHNLSFRKEDTLKMCMFFVTFFAYLLLISIIVIGLGGLFFSYGQAQAQGYFSSPNIAPYDPGSDWSFQMLSGIFGKDASYIFWAGGTGANTGNAWFTAIFAGVLALYSRALVVVAVIMMLYILVTALSSAARSGRPFGEQFDSMWAPIRFAIAFALMVPVAGSYNGAQMLVFQASEMGVNMANNIWLQALSSFQNQNQRLIRTAISENGTRFMRDVFLINACYYGYSTLLREGQITKINGQMSDPEETVNLFGYGSVTTITYGNKKSSDFCGMVELHSTVDVPQGYLSFQPRFGGAGPSETNYLPNVILRHFNMSARNFLPQANGATASSMGGDVVPRMVQNAFCNRDESFSELTCADGRLCNEKLREWFIGPSGYWTNAYGWTESGGFFDNQSYRDAENLFTSWIVSTLIDDSQYGWASAGVFYIRMSAAMSSVEEALNRLPRVVKLPVNVNKFYATPEDSTVTNQHAINRCGGAVKGGASICSQYKGSAALSSFLREANTWMINAPKNDPEFYSMLGGSKYDRELELPTKEPSTSNNTAYDVFDIVSRVTGTMGMDFKINDTSLHPLGQVIDLGKSFFNWASAIFGLAAVIGAVGAWFGFSAAFTVASHMVTFAQFLMVPGFFLMIMIPILPFLYFSLVVVEWAAAVIEAVIGMPLWVLTFFTSKGDLLGGAKAGVLMLFELMLRPTIIILSLLTSIILFSASVKFLGDAVELYMDVYGSNLGNSGVSGVSQTSIGVGFVIVYAVGIYLMAMSCFKIISVIPEHFGRWGNLRRGFGHGIFSGGVASDIAFATSAGFKKFSDMGADGLKGSMAWEQDNIETKKAYDTWRDSEIKENNEYNHEASKHNARVMEENKLRKARGEEELPYMRYRKGPDAVNMKEVRSAHMTNYVTGEYRSTLDYLKAKKGGSTWSAPVTGGSSSSMAQNLPSVISPNRGGGLTTGTNQQSSTNQTRTPPAGLLGPGPAATWQNPAGYQPKKGQGWSDRIGGTYIDFEEVGDTTRMPTAEEVKAAYGGMGLGASANASDVKKRYKELLDKINKNNHPDAHKAKEALLRNYNALKKHLGFSD